MSRLPREVRKQAERAKEIQTNLKVVPPEDGAELEGDPPAPPEGDPPVDWEHRFKTQKQKYDETIPVLRQENESLGQRVQELEDLLKKAKPDADPAVQAKPVFSEEEIEEYGEDFLNLITRVAGRRENPDNDVSKELAELKEQFGSIAETQAKTATDHFYADLGELVPDWETINTDPEFHAWLAAEAPLTGNERQVFLSEAQRQLDARKVAGFFTAWKSESGKQSYLPDSVAGQGAAVPVDEGHEIYTQQEIGQFYDDLKLGRYKHRKDEARQIEMKIFRAQKEGRIR